MDRIRGTSLTTSQRKDLEEQIKKKHFSKSEQEEIQALLPHRYGFPWYAWARQFYKSTNNQCFLVAANQVSKSSTQIRKFIEWATNDALWPKLWKTQPRQFWYLYPNKDTATIEFDLKWVPEFLPRGKMKEHAKCGWTADYERKKIRSLVFNTGVHIFFKTYHQHVQDLQSGSVHAIGFDEELPADLYDELLQRLSATEGYFSGVFTATLNQEFWRQVMEGEGEDEKLPDAFKLQVSKYDCLLYEDGSPGAYTEEKIAREIAQCKSQTEVARRIYGRFVTEEGRKYPAFEYDKHVVKAHEMPVPSDWTTYVGIDIGSGGVSNHPAAIVFIAINPLCNRGIVYDGWRGDGYVTESADIVNKYLELKSKNKVEPAQIFYDWHAKDFSIVAGRAGISLTKPDKSHATGEDIVNTLFNNMMLFIHETDELRKLGNELAQLMSKTDKTNARDDFSDALRYCLVGMPWDWNSIRSDAGVKLIQEKTVETRPLTDAEYQNWIDCQRKKVPFDELDKRENYERDSWQEFDEEIAEFDANFDP